MASTVACGCTSCDKYCAVGPCKVLKNSNKDLNWNPESDRKSVSGGQNRDRNKRQINSTPLKTGLIEQRGISYLAFVSGIPLRKKNDTNF